MSAPQLVQNAIHIVEDDIYLKSSHQHDCVGHVFEDGLDISVDGGVEYAKRGGSLVSQYETFAEYTANVARYEEWCIMTDDPFETVADRLLWGTRGKLGDQPLAYRPIKSFEIDHLRAILDNVMGISPLHAKVVMHWLEIKTKESVA